MKTYVVDTHAIVWFLYRDKRLSENARMILKADDVKLIIPTIVLAEIKYLFNKNKIKISLQDVVDFIKNDARCKIQPFDFSCVEAMNDRLNIHDAAIASHASVLKITSGMDVAIISKD
jgi:PIN domain nuclease of toxin-antitoxin system